MSFNSAHTWAALDGEPVRAGGQRGQGELAGVDRTIVLDQRHRLDGLAGPGTIKAIQLLEMGLRRSGLCRRYSGLLARSNPGSKQEVVDAGATHFIGAGYQEGRHVLQRPDYIAQLRRLINASGGQRRRRRVVAVWQNGASEGRSDSSSGSTTSPALGPERRSKASMAPVVEAYQAMRGASFLVAVTFAAEIGDVRRFDTPRQLMPSACSSGELDRRQIRRKGRTLAGNRRAVGGWSRRRGPIVIPQGSACPEGAARRAAQAGARHRLEGAGPSVRPLSPPQRHGQEVTRRRGCDRPRMAAFLWAIGREVAPA